MPNRTTLKLRAGVREDAAALGRILFEAFRSISSQHDFPWDFPSIDCQGRGRRDARNSGLLLNGFAPHANPGKAAVIALMRKRYAIGYSPTNNIGGDF